MAVITCPLHKLKLGLVLDLLSGDQSEIETTQLAKLPGLSSTNATCLYLLSANSGYNFSSTVKSWLLWENRELTTAVCRYIASPKGSAAAVEELENVVTKVEKALHSSNSLENSFLPNIPSLPDVIIWCCLQPVINVLCKNERFASLANWSDELCSTYPAFQKAKDNFKCKNYEAALIKEHERRSKVSPSVSGHKKEVVQSTTSGAIQCKPESGPGWLDSTSQSQLRPSRTAPVLPQNGRRNVLITSALPYVNNIPHLGNIIGCVLSADVYSRFCRARGDNCIYICGTDEYGTATETKALEEGVTPKEICDKYFAIHRDVYEWFNISFDCFGRTTTPYQTKISQDIFWKLDQNGFLVEESMEQLKCDKCDRFLADRFVEGECPHCGYADARGDQCDACGKLIDANLLKNPRCKICSATPRLETSNHLFLNLPLLESELGEVLSSRMSEGVWTDSATNITNAWLRDGLKTRCITRDLKWGTPVPKEPFTDKVFYVWFDAPIGYISITANYCGDKWTEWWKNPEQVEMFNFMAKDNVPFHSVIFPSTLLGARDGYGVVNSLVSVEYLNYEDGKFSKSRNVGVFGNNARDSGIPADVFRFYLLFVRPESQDSTFSWVDFATKSNSELLNNLGNFINRALSFCFNTFKGQVQEMTSLEQADEEVIDNVNKELQSYIECMQKVRIRDALSKILNVSRFGNGYIQSTQPWVLNKSSETEKKKRAGAINALCVNMVHLLAQMLEPFMPQTAFEIFRQLALYPTATNQNGLPTLPDCFIRSVPSGHVINKPVPLFKKLEESEVTKLKEMYGGSGGGSPAKKAEKTEGSTSGLADLSGMSAEELQKAVTEQGNKVRQLKAVKPPDKKLIGEEVEILKQLKSALEKASKAEEVSNTAAKAPPAAVSNGVEESFETSLTGLSAETLKNMATEQGNKVRALKAVKPPNKGEILVEVEKLKTLKNQLLVAMKEEEDRTAVYGTGPPEPQVQKVCNITSKRNQNIEKLSSIDISEIQNQSAEKLTLGFCNEMKKENSSEVVAKSEKHEVLEKNTTIGKTKSDDEKLSEQQETVKQEEMCDKKEVKSTIESVKSADNKSAGGDTNGAKTLAKIEVDQVKSAETCPDNSAEANNQKVAEAKAEKPVSSIAQQPKSDLLKCTETDALKSEETDVQKAVETNTDFAKVGAKPEQPKIAPPTSNETASTSIGTAVLETSFSSTTSGGSSGGAGTGAGAGAEGGKPHKKKKRPRNRKK